MDENDVFLVSELWVVPDSFDKLKIYRRMINTILEPYHPEIIFHNHAFEWVRDSENEPLPTGVEVVRFKNEKMARAAVAALATPTLKKLESEVFARVRCYLSRYAFPDNLRREIFNKKS